MLDEYEEAWRHWFTRRREEIQAIAEAAPEAYKEAVELCPLLKLFCNPVTVVQEDKTSLLDLLKSDVENS